MNGVMKLKTPEQSATTLQIIKGVAEGRMTAPNLTQERALETQEKYGPFIDKMTNMARDFGATQRAMGDLAEKARDSAPSQAANAAIMFGGAVMGTFAAPVALLTWGNLVSAQDIKESYSLPAEHITETYRKMDNVESSLKKYGEAAYNFQKTLGAFADAVTSGDDAKIQKAYESLSTAVKVFEQAVKDLTYNVKLADAYSGDTKGALEVLGKFAAEAAVTVVTAGAIGLAGKAVAYGARSAYSTALAAESSQVAITATQNVATFAYTEAGLTGAMAVGKGALHLGIGGAHGTYGATTLHEEVSEVEKDQENMRSFAETESRPVSKPAAQKQPEQAPQSVQPKAEEPQVSSPYYWNRPANP